MLLEGILRPGEAVFLCSLHPTQRVQTWPPLQVGNPRSIETADHESVAIEVGPVLLYIELKNADVFPDISFVQRWKLETLVCKMISSNFHPVRDWRMVSSKWETVLVSTVSYLLPGAQKSSHFPVQCAPVFIIMIATPLGPQYPCIPFPLGVPVWDPADPGSVFSKWSAPFLLQWPPELLYPIVCCTEGLHWMQSLPADANGAFFLQCVLKGNACV